MFVHLHGHSHYSLLEAIGTPANIVTKAQTLSMKAIGLTDYNGLYGAIDFYQQCQKHDIQPLIGIDIALVQDRHTQTSATLGHITLLAKHYDGYLALLELVSHANLEGFHEQPRIDRPLLEKYAPQLIGRCGGHNSVLGKLITTDTSEKKIHDTLSMVARWFNAGEFFLELLAQDETQYPHLGKLNQAVLHYSETIGCDVFCGTNYHYIESEDKEAFEVALSIKDGKRVFDDDRRKAQGDRHIMTEQEVRTILNKNGYTEGQINKRIATTTQIADMISLEIPLHTILFPKYESDEEIKTLYAQHKDSLLE